VLPWVAPSARDQSGVSPFGLRLTSRSHVAKRYARVGTVHEFRQCGLAKDRLDALQGIVHFFVKRTKSLAVASEFERASANTANGINALNHFVDRHLLG